MEPVIRQLATQVAERLIASRRTVATGESITGGGLAETLTSRAGASQWFRGGLITYATDTKVTLAGVPAEVIESAGVVSGEVAIALAEGARHRLGADVGVGVTGYAGPARGDEDRPVGTVWVAVALRDGTTRSRTAWFGDTRGSVRAHAQFFALLLLCEVLEDREQEAGE